MNSALGRLSVYSIAVGLLLTLTVKAPGLLIVPKHNVLRFWIDCATEDWPDDLRPVLVVEYKGGDWVHRLRYKPFDQDSQYLSASCELDKIEASRRFTVREWPGALPELNEINGLFRLDRGRVTSPTPQQDGLRDGFEIVFDNGNDLTRWASIAKRSFSLSSQFAVSDANDDRLLEPGALNLSNTPFPVLPVVIESNVAVLTNAVAIGRGTGRLGSLDNFTYEHSGGQLDVSVSNRILAFLEFLLGLLGPGLFGFGFGILTTSLKDRAKKASD
jgi:hypothetical protein